MSRKRHVDKEEAKDDSDDTISLDIDMKKGFAIFVGILFVFSSAAFAFYHITPDSGSGDGSSDGSHSTGTTSPGSGADLGPLGGVHEHFSLTVSIDGATLDFSRSRYQLQDQAFHFENGDGSTGHVHASGVTLGYAFGTLGMELTSQCLTLDDGRQFCDGGGKELRVLVNGEEATSPQDYQPADGDDVLVIYE